MRAKPRCAFNIFEATRPKSAWSIAKSFFAKYKYDNDIIIGKCFDFDWKCSTMDRMIKDPMERDAIYKFLRPKYGLIRETYKHLACVAPAGNVPSIGMNSLSELMLKCNDFVDRKITLCPLPSFTEVLLFSWKLLLEYTTCLGSILPSPGTCKDNL